MPGAPAQIINVLVHTTADSNKIGFNTGVSTSVCLDAVRTTCDLRWEIDATTATGSSNQSSKSTAPNIIVKLDYQWHAPGDQNEKKVLKSMAPTRAKFSTATSNTMKRKSWRIMTPSFLFS
jgi:hypothetical protein